MQEFISREKTHILVGFEASGRFHLGHYLILKNIIKEKKSHPNLKVTILVSDVHAKLNFKEDIEKNTIYAKEFIKKLLPFARICTTYELVKDPAYWNYVMEFVNRISFNDVYRATPLDVKIKGFQELKSIPGNYFLYSVMQAIDGHHLGADTIYCGSDQRKIYMFAYDTYKKLNWPKFNLVIYPLITMDGKLTQNIEEKMSKSKNCVALDSKLVQTAKKEITTGGTYLNYLLTPELLKVYNSSSKTEFLEELIQDLAFTIR